MAVGSWSDSCEVGRMRSGGRSATPDDRYHVIPTSGGIVLGFPYRELLNIDAKECSIQKGDGACMRSAPALARWGGSEHGAYPFNSLRRAAPAREIPGGRAPCAS